ncbi:MULTISPECIES: MurR/RpiR family transcriptional regulator [unclassified Janthinobacterium]|uniref:MurR/RpiR family transcriptional regulator n=1 Tax=unclassified Janthinobacterium TaxID=2610881 RepID=UPI001E4597DB|nr:MULTISPECIES: MurR/RpiR family transcriptional regulator [unclassified Janthinobacterium]MEC5161759.1 DNA-binding MurR/RpiR family transcriptional regulator [Janthinobacterium sp. CG_S6]
MSRTGPPLRETPPAGADAARPSADVAFAQSTLGQSLIEVLAHGSPSRQSIADFLLRHQLRATALGIEELAGQCRVSTATVSRFARELGFKNYAAMRAAVAQALQSALQPVEKLRSSIARRAGAAAPAMESLEYAAASIGATGQALSPSGFEQVVRRLGGARTVYVMGFGLSSHLASLLASHLETFCPHVVDVAGQGGTEVAAGRLTHITARDVLVAISLPRYALDAVRLVHFARDRGASVVALTDSPASPLAGLGDLVLYAHSSHPVLPSSSTAALAVIEALVVALMVSNKNNVDKAARLTEAVAAYLYGAEPAPGKPARKSRQSIRAG